jgi:hypothetical protein
VFKVLFSALLLLLVLMIAAHSVFVAIGLRSLLTGLPVRGWHARRDIDDKGQNRQGGLLFVVFGSVMVLAWGRVAVWAANALMGSIR